jgi:hypothetical protein
VNAKPENASFETIVSEALQKMKDATAASSSYEIDRSSGQWIVRRARKSGEKASASDLVAQLIAPAD